MAKKKPAKRRLTAKEKEQPPIPGTEQSDKIPAVHSAALEYADERDKRMLQSKEEHQAETRLIEQMQKHGIRDYWHGNVIVHLDGSTKAKVKVKNVEEE